MNQNRNIDDELCCNSGEFDQTISAITHDLSKNYKEIREPRFCQRRLSNVLPSLNKAVYLFYLYP